LAASTGGYTSAHKAALIKTSFKSGKAPSTKANGKNKSKAKKDKNA
jgi:hypothetical protein